MKPAVIRLCMALMLCMTIIGRPAQSRSQGLYEASVSVASTSDADREQGFTQALQRVFSRVAGTGDVADAEALKDLYQHPEQLIQAYRYTHEDNGQTSLQVSFGPVGVNQALAKAGIRVWGANRPQLVAWMAVSDSSGRQLVTPDGGTWAAA